MFGLKSQSAPLTCRVPQVPVLGAVLFTGYTSSVESLMRSFNISVPCNADDTQIYCPFALDTNESEVLYRLERCTEVLVNRNVK